MCICASAQSRNFQFGQWIEIQNAILKELNRSYVDSLPVDKMKNAAINAMLEVLDPYTIYVPEEEEEDFQMMVGKTYGGIGAIIYKPEADGNVIINEPYANSPAVKYGLQCGDEILTVDGVSTRGLNSQQSSDRMKGQPGTEVEFLVKKVHTGDTLTVRITREKIHLPDIEYAVMLDKTTGYISQTGFTEGVAEELGKQVEALKKQGMKKLVLDLRGNGGGLLVEAIKIVSLFVPKGSLVVSQKGKGPENNQSFKTWTDPIDVNLPLVVLVDNGSASASEIVAGALQDMDRATIMGTRTFGKGLVQSIKELPYGGTLKVTTAKYYTPSGRCVQAIDYSHRNEDGSVGHIPDSLTHVFHTASGREVRDGGGITPDVKLEYEKYSDLTYSLVMGQVCDLYAIEYFKNHKTIAPADKFVFDDREGFVKFAETMVKEKAKPELANINWDELTPFIEEEIVCRYYFQWNAVGVRVKYDKMLAEALTKPLI